MRPFLETERLSIRRFVAEDAPFILELLNQPSFLHFIADRNVRTIADAVAYIREKIEASYEQHGFGFYLVLSKNDSVALGLCGLIKRETLADVDIGFAFLERFWGKGYAFESAAAVLQYGRAELGLPKIVGVTSPQNRASIELLEKLGLKFERMIHLPGYGDESKLFA